ncbi:MAG: 5'-methylthioadenosine/S-adenosylhomocysteine nucleosidase [Bacillaceae bacterium G1]|nr:MAG: 5'-methylthioadenosine/S-adenosylhomocysteine nucleosidase [Bacillaceae bacterium G1]
MKGIGDIGGRQEERVKVWGNMTIQEQRTVAGISFWVGTFEGRDTVVCQCGVGKVNAAMCTQILIDRFDVEKIVFTGVAGALEPTLDIGDIVISTDCIQHDMDVRPLGFARGMIPFMDQSIFVADPELVALATRAAQEVLAGKQVVQGRILSGDQFVADLDTVGNLYLEFGGACVEMEGAAVAQVCSLNAVPFVIIRSMSDRADKSANVNFLEFVGLAAESSYRIVERMIRWL